MALLAMAAKTGEAGRASSTCPSQSFPTLLDKRFMSIGAK